MKNEKLYSISEFAEKVGLSRQAIYKRLNTDLSTYVVNVDNKQMLSARAFEIFGMSTKEIELTTVNVLEKIVKHLEKEVEQLRAENAELKEQLRAEREVNRNQTAELVNLTLQVSSHVSESLKQLTTERAAIEAQALANTLIENKRRHWWQRK